eukprot:TRINITY_DN1509_c0_g1_i2.p1 TRINITY_DN1509_c0_g1~~TRINITY_DN1509_c0_g1_i2.p1  ORF type:complete len:185 (+),score=23.13 TRINITY_DN1509_c0_g1_i2:58-612(+)
MTGQRSNLKTQVKDSTANSTFIYKVLKQVSPNTGISNNAMHAVNDFVIDMMRKLCFESYELLEMQGKKICSSREIQTSVRLVVPGELAKHAISEGTKACVKYMNYKKEGEGNLNKNVASGLTLSCSRIRNLMLLLTPIQSVGQCADIYLTAVLEYLLAEILELASIVTKDMKRFIRVFVIYLLL